MEEKVTEQFKESLMKQHIELTKLIKTHKDKHSEEYQVMTERLNMLCDLMDDLEINY